MRTGLGLNKKLTWFVARYHLFLFRIRKFFLGFEYANLHLKQLDKKSLFLILKKSGARIGKDCDIETGLTFHNCKNYSNLEIRDNCHIGKNCFFDLKDKITILDNVTISMECKLITHIDMGKSKLSENYPQDHKPILIETDVYIGVNSTILSGVKINKSSIVAAGSVVIRDVFAHTVVGGVPAGFIKYLKKN